MGEDFLLLEDDVVLPQQHIVLQLAKKAGGQSTSVAALGARMSSGGWLGCS